MSPGMWHKTLIYLGLKEEPEEGYDELPERLAADATPRHRPIPAYEDDARRPAPLADEPAQASNVRQLHGGDVQVVRPAMGGSPGSALRTPVVEILVFDDVEAVGARYRTGQAVLFDVSKADAATGRRVVDFVSGMTYVSRGSLSKAGDRAFLLVPEGIMLSDDERVRLTELGYAIDHRENA